VVLHREKHPITRLIVPHQDTSSYCNNSAFSHHWMSFMRDTTIKGTYYIV